jgi:hypothetical protein
VTGNTQRTRGMVELCRCGRAAFRSCGQLGMLKGDLFSRERVLTDPNGAPKRCSPDNTFGVSPRYRCSIGCAPVAPPPPLKTALVQRLECEWCGRFKWSWRHDPNTDAVAEGKTAGLQAGPAHNLYRHQGKAAHSGVPRFSGQQDLQCCRLSSMLNRTPTRHQFSMIRCTDAECLVNAKSTESSAAAGKCR